MNQALTARLGKSNLHVSNQLLLASMSNRQCAFRWGQAKNGSLSVTPNHNKLHNFNLQTPLLAQLFFSHAERSRERQRDWSNGQNEKHTKKTKTETRNLPAEVWVCLELKLCRSQLGAARHCHNYCARPQTLLKIPL